MNKLTTLTTLIAFMMASTLSGCLTAGGIVGGVKTGADLYVTIKQAKTEANLHKRVEIYADFYCSVRQDNPLVADTFYDKAAKLDVDEATLDLVRARVDEKCA